MFAAASIAYQSLVYFLPFLLWPSRRNIFTILSLPTFFIAHLLGTWVFEGQAKDLFGVTSNSIDEYTLILLLGFCFRLPATLAGYFIKTDLITAVKDLGSIFFPKINTLLNLYGTTFVVLTIVLFTGTYIGIGFAPLLTANPQSARFFANEYEAAYRPYASLFRLSLIFSPLSILILLLRLLRRIRLFDVILFMAVALLLTLSVRRALIFSTIVLVFLCYFCFRRKQLFWPMVGLYSLGVGVGSAIFSLAVILVLSDGRPVNILSVLVSGLPDVRDSLWFIDSWLRGKWDLTFGLSVVGGLVPQQFPFNPTILSKLVIGSFANAATGGFRLDAPTLGYIAFSWPGVALFSAISGLATGLILRASEQVLTKVDTLEEFILWTFIFQQLFGLSTFFINMQIDVLVGLVAAFLIFAGTRIRV